MFARFLRKLRQAPRHRLRSRRLEVEALEGRCVPSAVGTRVRPAPGVEQPPSPPGGSHVREPEPLGGGNIIKIIVPSGAADPGGDVTLFGSKPGGAGDGRQAASNGGVTPL